MVRKSKKKQVISNYSTILLLCMAPLVASITLPNSDHNPEGRPRTFVGEWSRFLSRIEASVWAELVEEGRGSELEPRTFADEWRQLAEEGRESEFGSEAGSWQVFDTEGRLDYHIIFMRLTYGELPDCRDLDFSPDAQDMTTIDFGGQRAWLMRDDRIHPQAGIIFSAQAGIIYDRRDFIRLTLGFDADDNRLCLMYDSNKLYFQKIVDGGNGRPEYQMLTGILNESQKRNLTEEYNRRLDRNGIFFMFNEDAPIFLKVKGDIFVMKENLNSDIFNHLGEIGDLTRFMAEHAGFSLDDPAIHLDAGPEQYMLPGTY